MPPNPVKISHKKDGRQRWQHRFHVSLPPPYPAAGSVTEQCVWRVKMSIKSIEYCLSEAVRVKLAKKAFRFQIMLQ